MKGLATVFLRDSIFIIGGQFCYSERFLNFDKSPDLVDVGIQVVQTEQFSLAT